MLQRSCELPPGDAVVLLTNGRGGMARLRVDLGQALSKYDCLLGANLHPSVPVDRHVFAKRVRAWVNADGFISALEAANLVAFTVGPPATWTFVANAGDGRALGIALQAGMEQGRNTTLLRWQRVPLAPGFGRELEKKCSVSLILRVDIEDRNFHSETHRQPGAESHFAAHCAPVGGAGDAAMGFRFTPAADRGLCVTCDRGVFHPQPEWSEGIHHVVESSRGLVDRGDAYSPGWFEIPLCAGEGAVLAVTAEDPASPSPSPTTVPDSKPSPGDEGFEAELRRAVDAFVVRRGDASTVIAGYPWFLDWGRDTLIAARGLLAADKVREVEELLAVFGGFEEDGTLPNAIFGENASNRDTTDAPLWYGVVCDDLLNRGEPPGDLASLPVGRGTRTVGDVLRSIAVNYRRRTPNGISMDETSGLIWSPSHFTWMDTNHPAGTPREGYPVEIQALWISLLRLLARLEIPADGESWEALARRAARSFEVLFWIEKRGWLADVLLGAKGVQASSAVPQDALRPNALLAINLGLAAGVKAKACVAAVSQNLLVPGALRSLAPLPVTPPLPIHGAGGHLLNNPSEPYWGRYEGDEDTRRKPAYHNGTAWTWLLPAFCEALALAWENQPQAVAAAKAYLGSARRLMREGCLGQIPEILDGDNPHAPRGCDAQAWAATEALRVWRRLTRFPEPGGPRR